jgi:hypothetical protein
MLEPLCVGDGVETIIIKNRCQDGHSFWFIDVVGGSWLVFGGFAFGFIRVNSWLLPNNR